MSLRALGAVWRMDLAPPAKLVALALADHADGDGGSVYPTVERLEAFTGLSRRTVQRILRELEEVGVLVFVAPSRPATKAHRGRGTEYRIDLDRGVTVTPLRGERGVNQDTGGASSTTQEGRQPDALTKNKNQEPEPSEGLAPLAPRTRAPNVVFDAVADAWGLPYGGGGQAALVGKVSAWLRSSEPDLQPSQLASLVYRVRDLIPKDWEPTTPAVLQKWWHVLRAERTPGEHDRPLSPEAILRRYSREVPA